jgi:hypothetical protein
VFVRFAASSLLACYTHCRDVTCVDFVIGPAPIFIIIVIVINACISFQRRRNSTPFRRCVPRTHSWEVEVRARGREEVAASSASAQAPHAPTVFRGYARVARGGCLRSAQRDGGRLPVWWVSDYGLLFLEQRSDRVTYVA